MKRPNKQVFCPECGSLRISHPGSQYAVCPHGHGKLVPRFSKTRARAAFVASLPRACRVGRNLFKIHRRAGLFGYRDGSGRRPARPGTPVGPDEVVARHVIGKRLLIRVFARKFQPAVSGGDGAP